MPTAPSKLTRRAFLGTLSASAGLFAGCPVTCDRVHILGSGITGLCAGALLAKRGLEVHVLESHPESIGGHAAGFEQAGFQFCVGPQSVWNFRGEGIGIQVLQRLGLADRVPFDSMAPEGFEQYAVGDERAVAVPMGLDHFREVAIDQFPGDYVGLDRFFAILQDLHQGARTIDRYGLYEGGEDAMALGLLLDGELSPGAKARFYQCRQWSLKTLFDYCGLSQGIWRLLFGNAGIFAENESQLSCVAYAAATGFYHAGADYPRFGFESLVQGLADTITNAGGTVETGKRITRLQRRGFRVVRISCQDGDTMEADCVISTLSPRLTFRLIQPPAPAQATYAPSNTAISAFIGVRNYPGLPQALARRTLWWQDGNGEVEFEAPDMRRPPRLLAVGSPSSNGVHNRNSHPGDHSLIVFAPGNYAQAAAAYARSPTAHDDLRDEIASSLVDQLETHLLPGLGPYIRFMEVHTPYDLYLRTRGESGNIYGRRLTPESLLARPFTPHDVANLHIVCASAGMPGIATAFQTAARLVDAL